MSALSHYHSDEFVLHALKNNCSREVYDTLFEAYPNSVSFVS
jgi:hypothetical protein